MGRHTKLQKNPISRITSKSIGCVKISPKVALNEFKNIKDKCKLGMSKKSVREQEKLSQSKLDDYILVSI